MIIGLVIIVVGVVVAAIVRRRTDGKPAQGASWTVPAQLDRRDFDQPDVPTLIVEFSSATCDACAATWTKVQSRAGGGVAAQEVAYQTDQALHDRYRIDAVPTVLIVDAEGVVTASFVGNPTDAELDEALAAHPV